MGATTGWGGERLVNRRTKVVTRGIRSGLLLHSGVTTVSNTAFYILKQVKESILMFSFQRNDEYKY